MYADTSITFEGKPFFLLNYSFSEEIGRRLSKDSS